MTATLDARAAEILSDRQRRVHIRTDRMMLAIFLAQWLLAITIAIVVTPYTWAGRTASLHMHLKVALGLGLLLNVLPALLVALRPGAAVTRHVIAVVQMLWSALLIHLTGGRIETHFHVFGSLAFLAFYRDWRVLPTATLVVVVDHMARGLLVPESVYGVVNPAWWRFLEHAAWVLFEDVVLVLGCVRQLADNRGIAQRQAELESLNRQIEQKVIVRTSELEAERKRYQSLVEGTNVVPWEIDAELGKMVYVGPQISSLGYTSDELRTADFWKQCVHPDDRPRYTAELARAIADEVDCALEYRLVAKDGSPIHVRDVVSARARDGSGRRVVRGIVIDVSERKKLESELAQAQKLEAVGQLAAGIAHEINTPVQFVNDSVHFVRGACDDVSGLVRKYQALRAAVQGGRDATALADELEREEAGRDLDFTLENVPKALDLSIEGLSRVAGIVRSMKIFAHPDGDETDVDLNEGLQSTLTIARNEYKYVADVETDLGDLPLVRCRFGELNQVFLNLIVNAAHAIAQAVEGTDRRGKISVRSRAEAGHVTVAIADDGCGIPEAIRDKIFEQFFTTKPVGKGSGQGLSIARSVVERHGGTLSFSSEMGRGTTFTIELPFRTRDALAA